MSEEQKSQRLIWIDLEMTGLNPEYDHVIEVATIVTDADLNILAEGPTIAILQGYVSLPCGTLNRSKSPVAMLIFSLILGPVSLKIANTKMIRAVHCKKPWKKVKYTHGD